MRSAAIPKVIAAAFTRDVVWRVPGDTIMSGEYHGPRDVVEFLRRTGTETDGTYRSRLHTVRGRRRVGSRRLSRARARATGSTSTSTRRSSFASPTAGWPEVTAVPLDSASMRSGPEPFDSADVQALAHAQQAEMRGLYERRGRHRTDA